MSSLQIFRDKETGVAASWNKEGGYTVSYPDPRNPTVDALTVRHVYPNEKSAVRAAKRLAKKLLADPTFLPFN